MPSILFVCTGNTCRSPMAEHLFKKILAENPELSGNWQVFSAGISAWPGDKASEGAIRVMAEEGIDLSSHRSQVAAEEFLKQVDLILTMGRGHKELLQNLHPELQEKIFTLKEFAGEKWDLDIADPFGQGEEIYRQTRDEIKKYLYQIIGPLQEFKFKAGNYQVLANNKNNRGEKRMKIAIASDHAGYELKQVVIEYLQKEGYAYTDLGTDSTESVDYPDFAYQVANGVAKGEYERGILICGTGIGMSIAANKVKGIRAALCHDVFSAGATRKHNDSNVLTMGSRVIGQGLAIEIVKTWLETEFEGDRHARRVQKINSIERGDYQDNE